METTRLTVAQAIVKFLMAQRIVEDGREAPLFPGVFAIFGHGNVTCMGDALEAAGDAAAAAAEAKRFEALEAATDLVRLGVKN
jgi:TPP-dependent trihydroxycyclohexane-1,2-dione (THcHDO) dehydratase